jgi:hypothetical protein
MLDVCGRRSGDVFIANESPSGERFQGCENACYSDPLSASAPLREIFGAWMRLS